MVQKIKLVRGDTLPQIKLTLTDAQTGAALDLTGATVRMYFRAFDTTTILDTLIGVVTDPLNGVVIFSWRPATLDVDSGDYEGEIEVTDSLGGIQTLYDPVRFFVREDFN